MRYIDLAGTSLRPSVLALGTNRFGTLIDRGHAFELLDLFVERGGSMIDTAHVYANWIAGATPSASEKTIGAWLASRNCRDQLVLATKAGHPDLKTRHVPRLSARELRDDVAQSVDYLQTDFVDLLWLHRDAPEMPVGEIVLAMNEVIRSGKVRHVGCSNWRVERIREANRFAHSHGLHGFVASQPQWSLAVPNRARLSDQQNLVVFGAEELEFHSATAMPVVAYSAQAQGFFEKLDRLGNDGLSDEDRQAYFSTANARLLPKVRELAARHGISINALTLAFLLSQRFATMAVVGPRTADQLRDSIAAVDVKLSPDELAHLQHDSFAGHVPALGPSFFSIS